MTPEEEIAKGQRAQKLYNEFGSEFFETKRAVLIDAFASINPSQINDIMEIKRTLMVLNALDQEIQQYILTGKLASITKDETGQQNDS